MQTYTATFSSDQINRYGMKFPISALERCLDQAWKRPRPSSIGHDLHRPIGVVRARALYLQPGLARLFGTIDQAENAEDFKTVRHVLNASVAEQVESLDPGRVGELRERLDGFLSNAAQLHSQSCVSIVDPGIAARLFPDLFSSGDKHGLIQLSKLNPVGPGVFEQDGVLLFAHRYFRRSLSYHNTLNDPFLERLVKFAEKHALDVRIALDTDLVGHPETLERSIELQYWWGPRFSDELGEIEMGISRHEATDSERFFSSISATEFWWYEQDKMRTFECEELRDLNSPSLGQSASSFGCRFVHSIIDPETGLPNHLDGAVRIYDEALAIERADKTIYDFGRKADYNKIWRIDGKIPFEEWKALINDYYRDNHLVGEYFGGREGGKEYTRPTCVTSPDSPKFEDFVPCTMSRGDGIRIAISYHHHNNQTGTRIIVPLEEYDVGAGRKLYFESATLDLIKLLKRNGAEVTIFGDVSAIEYEDMVDNLPLIEHCGPHATSHAQDTLTAIRAYCVALAASGNDRMITFNIAVRFDDRDAQFSFAGQVDDINCWLEADQSILPSSPANIGAWAEAAGLWLTDTFDEARDVPAMENILKIPGFLIADRKLIKRKDWKFVDADGWRCIGLEETPELLAALPMLKASKLSATYAAIIKRSRCGKCGGFYEECDCIRFIDRNVSLEMVDADVCTAFWTDRTSWDGRMELCPGEPDGSAP